MSVSQSPDLSSDVNGFHTDDLLHEAAFASRGCCFWLPCLRSSPSKSWWERIRAADNDDEWWLRGWKRFRDWSEIVAGPKWKTFIRQFHKNRHRQSTYRYDPLSYALNFDEGPALDDPFSEDFMRRDFSMRFASIPASAKSSMDLGKDGPSFIWFWMDIIMWLWNLRVFDCFSPEPPCAVVVVVGGGAEGVFAFRGSGDC